MSTPPVPVQEATDDHVDRIEELLAANDLPVADLRRAPGQFFVARTDSEIVGAGGIEIHGSNGLIRSLVVAETHRGRGYGSALYDALEYHARANDVDSLYLLTTAASGFFADCGYRRIGREQAPTAIRETPQFTDLCPASATCMGKHVG